MEKSITKNLMCILVRGNLEIWVEEEKIQNISDMIEKGKLIKIGNEIINSKDITGIFSAKTMEDLTRRKNGQWQGKNGKWYNKGDNPCPTCGHIIPWGMKCGNCSY